MSNKKNKVSQETQQDALAMAKSIQKPGQTKEQTKLIAQGIEHGISLYKKQQKEKQRQADKVRKKQLREKQDVSPLINNEPQPTVSHSSQPIILPWALLIASWLLFALYFVLK